MRRVLEGMIRWLGLRREEYVRQAVEAAAFGAYQNGHAAGQVTGYQIGLAHGELKGRDALALELQIKHGMGEGGEQQMTRDDIANLRTRQVH